LTKGTFRMTIEQLRVAYEATPFHSFIIHLADGRQLPVMSREFISFAPSGRTFIVHQADDAYSVVDLLLVTELEFKPTGQPPSRRRRA
jgi:hypothetical protein